MALRVPFPSIEAPNVREASTRRLRGYSACLAPTNVSDAKYA